MDLFGKKERALENVIRAQAVHITQQNMRELTLQDRIRNMDQYIFAMAQCSSWNDMQPIFAKLKTFTDQRMIDESNRIKSVLIPEMQKVYR